MLFYWSEGGDNYPTFKYRFLMRRVTVDMMLWAKSYPSDSRYHILYFDSNPPPHTIFQIDSEGPAQIFRLAYSEYIIKELTYYEETEE